MLQPLSSLLVEDEKVVVVKEGEEWDVPLSSLGVVEKEERDASFLAWGGEE